MDSISEKTASCEAVAVFATSPSASVRQLKSSSGIRGGMSICTERPTMAECGKPPPPKSGRRPHLPGRQRPAPPHRAPETAPLDPVEQAGLESFPASDAPSWTP